MVHVRCLGEMCGACEVFGRYVIVQKILSENLNPVCCQKIKNNIKTYFRDIYSGMSTGFIWLCTQTF